MIGGRELGFSCMLKEWVVIKISISHIDLLGGEIHLVSSLLRVVHIARHNEM